MAGLNDILRHLVETSNESGSRTNHLLMLELYLFPFAASLRLLNPENPTEWWNKARKKRQNERKIVRSTDPSNYALFLKCKSLRFVSSENVNYHVIRWQGTSDAAKCSHQYAELWMQPLNAQPTWLCSVKFANYVIHKNKINNFSSACNSFRAVHFLRLLHIIQTVLFFLFQ